MHKIFGEKSREGQGRNKLPSAGSLYSKFKTVLKTEIIV